MADWPTLDEVRAELRLDAQPAEDPLIEMFRLAAVDFCDKHYEHRFAPPDIPANGKTACLLLASRWYRRRDSLDGTIGWGEMGVVRVGRIDPDIDAMLGVDHPRGGAVFA